MSEIGNQIITLCDTMAENNYQMKFEGNFDQANKQINEDLSKIIGYQNIIIQNTVDRTMLCHTYTHREIAEDEHLKQIDDDIDARNVEGLKNAREGIKDLNSICRAYGVKEIGPSNNADIYEVADFVGNFCSQIYEDGKPRNENELMNYREKDKRTDRYETANALVKTLVNSQNSDDYEP